MRCPDIGGLMGPRGILLDRHTLETDRTQGGQISQYEGLRILSEATRFWVPIKIKICLCPSYEFQPVSALRYSIGRIARNLNFRGTCTLGAIEHQN